MLSRERVLQKFCETLHCAGGHAKFGSGDLHPLVSHDVPDGELADDSLEALRIVPTFALSRPPCSILETCRCPSPRRSASALELVPLLSQRSRREFCNSFAEPFTV